MNPYETDPTKIPENDRYADVPFFGRYFPRPDDFKPDLKHVNSNSAESLEYWTSVLKKCGPWERIYEAEATGRDVFALGTVIIKSNHLKEVSESDLSERNYTYVDSNEVKAIAVAKTVLHGVKVPDIYFTGKIHGQDVLVQERIPGIALTVAWQYISQAKKTSFKQQARTLLRHMHDRKPPSSCKEPSYIDSTLDTVKHRGLQEHERDILFSNNNDDQDLGFMHNDFSQSNCIVDDGKIVGVIDWEVAGWFTWKSVADVHVRIRMPRLENYAHLDLDQDFLDDILFWNDLYEDGRE